MQIIDGIGQNILRHIDGIREIIPAGVAAVEIGEVDGIRTVILLGENGGISVFVHNISPFEDAGLFEPCILSNSVIGSGWDLL